MSSSWCSFGGRLLASLVSLASARMSFTAASDLAVTVSSTPPSTSATAAVAPSAKLGQCALSLCLMRSSFSCSSSAFLRSSLICSGVFTTLAEAVAVAFAAVVVAGLVGAAFSSHPSKNIVVVNARAPIRRITP
jgi:hypothetical protein